nr:reverse transcriptase domain-containing protein [Tanacetum cinerariifolium]
MDKSESYLAAPKHRECYEGLIKSYELDTTIISTYGKVYSTQDEDPSVGSDRGLKKRKTSKDAELPKCPKAKESQSGSSKGDKSQSKSSGKSVLQRNQSLRLQTRICQKIKRRTQVMMMKNPMKRLHLNMTGSPNLHNLKNLMILIKMLARLYNKDKIKAGSFKKLDWENPKGGDYLLDLTKPLPLVMSGNCQIVLVHYFINNNLKYLQGGVLTMTYTAFITKTKATQYDLLEDVEPKQIILDPDDQPMWESTKSVAPTPSSAIIQLDVDDNFVVNTTHLNMIRENKFNSYLRANPHDHISEFLAICNMFRYGKTQSEAIKLWHNVIFNMERLDFSNELGAQVFLFWWPSYLVWGARSMEWWPRVDCMRWRLALKGVWRCRVVCGIQGGDEVVWLALELKGGDGGACGLLGDVRVKVVVRSWC